MKKICFIACFQSLLLFTLQAAGDKIIVDYGQELDSIVSYDKQDNFVSKTRYFFDQDLLKSMTVETSHGVYTYNYTQKQDNVIEEIIFGEKNAIGSINNQTKKTLERSPEKTAEYNYIWQNDAWKDLDGSVMNYSNGLVTRYEGLEGSGSGWIVSNHIDYTYYTTADNPLLAGKLKEIHSFADEKDESSKTTYSYNIIGGFAYLQSEMVYAVDDAGVFQKCMSTEYSYPSNNQENVTCIISYFDPESQKLVGKENHALSGQSGVLDTYQIQMFDSVNTHVKTSKYDYSYLNGKQTVEEMNTISDLLAKGLKQEQTRYSSVSSGGSVNLAKEVYSGEKWVKDEESSVLYNDKGDLVNKEIRKYISESTSVPVYKTEWNYDPNAGIDTYVVYVYDESLSRVVKGWSFSVFYPGNPDGIEKINIKTKETLSIYPNPASENIFVTGSDSFDEPVQYAIYNLTGKLLKKGIVYSSQEAISVTELTPGNYLLRLGKENKFASCVFIKQ